MDSHSLNPGCSRVTYNLHPPTAHKYLKQWRLLDIQVPTNFPSKMQTLTSPRKKQLQWVCLTFSRWSRMCDAVAVMHSSICKIFGKYALIRWLMFFNTVSRLFKIPCWRPKGRTLDKSKSSTAWMTAEWHSPNETKISCKRKYYLLITASFFQLEILVTNYSFFFSIPSMIKYFLEFQWFIPDNILS